MHSKIPMPIHSSTTHSYFFKRTSNTIPHACRFTGIAFFALALSLSLSLLTFSCSDQNNNQLLQDNATTQDYLNKEDLNIKHFQTYLIKNTNKTWNLIAKNAKIYNKSNVTVLQQVHMDSLSLQEKPLTTIIANKATIDNTTKDVILEGDVVINKSNKVIIEGEYFIWHHDKELFTSDQKVSIKKKGEGIISGVGFESTTNFDNIIFYEQTSGVIEDNAQDSQIQ